MKLSPGVHIFLPAAPHSVGRASSPHPQPEVLLRDLSGLLLCSQEGGRTGKAAGGSTPRFTCFTALFGPCRCPGRLPALRELHPGPPALLVGATALCSPRGKAQLNATSPRLPLLQPLPRVLSLPPSPSPEGNSSEDSSACCRSGRDGAGVQGTQPSAPMCPGAGLGHPFLHPCSLGRA